MSHNPYSPPRVPVDDDADVLAPMRRPATVTAAFVIFLIGLAADTVNFAATLSGYGMEMVNELRVIGMFVGLVLALWLYSMIFRGRNWARMVTLVLTSFGFVMLYRELPLLAWYGISRPQIMLSLVRPVCSSIALFLVFGPGREWFRRRPMRP